MFPNPSHSIVFLRSTGIYVSVAAAITPNSGIFLTWEDFYNWFQTYTALHPEKRFHIIGDCDGYQSCAVFRIEWFGAGVSPVEHRNTCTLSRWHYETNQYVEINPELTTHGTVKATLDRLHFIYMNGTPDHHNAIANFDIDAVFINSDGTAV